MEGTVKTKGLDVIIGLVMANEVATADGATEAKVTITPCKSNELLNNMNCDQE